MAWKEITGGTAVDIKKQGKGFQLEGVYRGHKTIQTKLGEQVLYKIETEDGVEEVYGFGSLNYKLGSVKEGTPVRIIYEGQSQVKNKFSKFPHLCKVEVDTEGEAEAEAEEYTPE